MDFISTSIDTHIYAIIFLVAIMFFNLYSVISIKSYIDLYKRLKVMTPVFHFANAIVAYTGGIVAAFSHNLSPMVIIMIIVTIFIMVLEIKRYKKMRVIKLAQIELQDEFRKFAKKNYMIQIVTYVIVFGISFFYRLHY